MMFLLHDPITRTPRHDMRTAEGAWVRTPHNTSAPIDRNLAPWWLYALLSLSLVVVMAATILETLP